MASRIWMTPLCGPTGRHHGSQLHRIGTGISGRTASVVGGQYSERLASAQLRRRVDGGELRLSSRVAEKSAPGRIGRSIVARRVWGRGATLIEQVIFTEEMARAAA